MLDHSFMFEVLGDSPENIERINNTLFDIKTMSYGASYIAQKKLAGIHKYSCPFSDGVIERGTEYVFTIPYTYIELRHRIEIKQSEYYKREVKYSTILANPEIFQTSILMFVDGKLFKNFSVVFMEDYLQVRFGRYKGSSRAVNDGMTISDIQALQSSTVTFIFMPLNRHRISVQENAHFIATNTIIHGDSDVFTTTSNIKTSNIPMLFIYPKNVNNTYDTKFGYSFASSLDPADEYSVIYDNTKFTSLMNELNLAIQPYNSMEVHLIYPQDLYKAIGVGSDGWFETDIKDLPIPTENILIFKNTSSGIMYDNDATIQFHYPNIYKIVSSDEDATGYFVYVFYNEDTEGIGLYHENELGLYYEFISNILDKYKDNTIPTYIKNYDPVEIDYSIDDFKESNEEGLEYKINTLRELIAQNPFLYSVYLSKYAESYPIIRRVVDQEFLDTRLRYSTASDIPTLVPPATFEPEGRYLFSIRNSSNNQTCLFFVDNKFIYPDRLYYTDNVVYMYFPHNVINLATKIEILFIFDVSMAVPMTIDSSIAMPIELNPKYRVSAEDLFVTKTIDGIETYLNSGFAFYEKIDTSIRELLVTDITVQGEYYREITTTKFKRYDTVYLIAENSLNGVDIVVRSDKTNIFRTTYGEAPNYTIRKYLNNADSRNFLLYRDGRLMSRSGITFRANSTPSGPHTVFANVLVSDQIPITILHSSEKYNLDCQYHTGEVKRLRIYHKYLDVADSVTDRDNNIYDKIMDSSQELTEEMLSHGHLVDLTGLISKPLSFEWFDIYMNGLKLTPDDVIIVAPYKLLILIDDDYPDIDSFIIIDIITFIDEYLQMLINPDLQQVTQPMKNEFPELLDNNDNIPLNGDIIYNIRSNIMLNPDENGGYEFIVINGISGE